MNAETDHESAPQAETSPRRRASCVSVVAPAYNEEESVAEFCRRVTAALEGLGQPFEIVVVDNGSADATLAILRHLHASDPRINYVSLSRNFGHQGGLVAGLEHARGDVVVSMDCDLQHPPEAIPEMLELWSGGTDIVFTLKTESAAEPAWRRVVNRIYYRLISRWSGLDLNGGQSDFRLMDRKAVKALLSLPERAKFLRGLSQWLGFRQASIEYRVADRFAGRSKFRFVHLVRFALDGVLSFSIVPLRVLTGVGAVVSVLSLGYVVLVIGLAVAEILVGQTPEEAPSLAQHAFSLSGIPVGYPSLAAGVFFLGGVQLMAIGLLGEYVGRIYDEVKHRPIYLVDERSVEHVTGCGQGRAA